MKIGNGHKQLGFTLIELIIVIVILGILSIAAAPRFLDISRDAKISVLNSIAGQVKSTIKLVQAKAALNGISAVSTNPQGGQSGYVVDFGFGSSELMYSNLCPESIAELGDRLYMLDFLDLSLNSKLETLSDNQYTLIGFDLPVSGRPLDAGCYIIYDSFAEPNCTVVVVDADC